MLDLRRQTTADYQRADAAHHLHPFTDYKALKAEGSRVIVKGEGSWLWDFDGKKYLDGMAGLWCSQVGHGRREIADAVHKQMCELEYYNTFFKTTHPGAVELAEQLSMLTPKGLDHVFFTGSGSEANDTVYRLVRHYWQLMGKPEKKVIIGRRLGYHGSTVAASALGGMGAMHGQGGMLPDVHHIEPPYWFDLGGDMDKDEFGRKAAAWLAEAIEEIGEDNVAAFIAEPIQGAGGVIIPPETYWPEVKKILEGKDILFVADEVICGFGRTGEWFGSDYYGLSPDLMPFAKGVTSGYLPLGGVMVSDRIADVIVEKGGEFFHGFTYSAHPAACAAALANLKILKDENVVQRVKEDVGPYLQERWRALGEHPLVGEARMLGLFGCLELVPNKPSRSDRFENAGNVGLLCRDISFNNGLIMRSVRDGMIISPPLTITHDEIDQLVALARKTLDDTQAELKRRGLMG